MTSWSCCSSSWCRTRWTPSGIPTVSSSSRIWNRTSCVSPCLSGTSSPLTVSRPCQRSRTLAFIIALLFSLTQPLLSSPAPSSSNRLLGKDGDPVGWDQKGPGLQGTNHKAAATPRGSHWGDCGQTRPSALWRTLKKNKKRDWSSADWTGRVLKMCHWDRAAGPD